jgi:hypothetical protein
MPPRDPHDPALTPNEIAALIVLVRAEYAGESLTRIELATRIGIEGAYATREARAGEIVRGLRRRGALQAEKRLVPGTKRLERSTFHLTTEGRAAAMQLVTEDDLRSFMTGLIRAFTAVREEVARRAALVAEVEADGASETGTEDEKGRAA